MAECYYQLNKIKTIKQRWQYKLQQSISIQFNGDILLVEQVRKGPGWYIRLDSSRCTGNG